MPTKDTRAGQNRRAVLSYALRRIDPDLWRKVKSRAAYEGRSVRFVIMELLKVYATHGFEVVETFNNKDEK